VSFDLFHGGVHIGSVVRCGGGQAFAYLPNGEALGTFADLDAAAAALSARMQREASHAPEAA
jgi:hypothetical protein